MPIINKTTQPERVVPPVTNYKNRIIANNTYAFNTLKTSIKNSFDTVWNNQDYTAQEVLASFGTDAKALFELSYQAQLILKSIDSSYEFLVPPQAYTIHEDGTVTINE